jgi:hypothetical protein
LNLDGILVEVAPTFLEFADKLSFIYNGTADGVSATPKVWLIDLSLP